MLQEIHELTPEDTHSTAMYEVNARLRQYPRPDAEKAASAFRVLVVDDEPSFTEMIHAFLLQRDMDVESASDGSSAQEKMERKKYDLVLSDVRMPQVDGMELLQWIRERHPQTDVILMTGEHPADAVEEARRHGATDFLAKPFSANQMRAAIERCRQRRLAADARETSQTALLLKPLIHEMSAGLENAVTMLKMMQRSEQTSSEGRTNPNLDATIINLFRLMGLTEEYCRIAFSLDDGEEVHADQFDLQLDVVEKILDEFKFEIKRKKIEVIQKRDRYAAFEPKVIKGNRVLLRSVFRTLIGNTVKCCNENGTITYRCKRDDFQYEFHFAHEGQPLPADLNQPTAQEGKGIGYTNGGLEFGLSMANSILRYYNGNLSCEPVKNGSRFVVCLPR